MRYPASEKLEIIRLVEQSSLPVRRTLTKLGIPRATFYRWYDRYSGGGPEALTDRSPRPDRVWNRIPDDVRQRIIQLALEEPALSPRELAVRFTDSQSYFVSEASVYRLLKAHDLIASPSRPSSTTTTTAATTRASTISPRPTSTSDAGQPSWPNEKGSSDRPLLTAACSTGCRPPDFTNPDEPEPPLIYPARCPENPDDGHSHRRPPAAHKRAAGRNEPEGCVLSRLVSGCRFGSTSSIARQRSGAGGQREVALRFVSSSRRGSWPFA
jgi:transposase-like protein